MLHARKSYNERVQDSAGLIPMDEPVFLLRGHDPFAPALLDIYAACTEAAADGDPSIVSSVRSHADQMRRWQNDECKKTADMDASDDVYLR